VETWDAIRARRNVRTYTDEPISTEDLDRILEAGWRAPSASNRQRWEFIAITDKGQLDALGGVWQGARHIPGAQAAIVLLVPEPNEERFVTLDRYDLGQATYAMMLAAADLGIGSGHSAIRRRRARSSGSLRATSPHT
jgi:nitroreductase